MTTSWVLTSADATVRRRAYDEIHSDFLENGLSVEGFYANRGYFGVDENGRPVPWKSSHPTLAHWPLNSYQGGQDLTARLQRERHRLIDIIRRQNASWIDPRHWHSTVFAPCHSSNP